MISKGLLNFEYLFFIIILFVLYNYLIIIIGDSPRPTYNYTTNNFSNTENIDPIEGKGTTKKIKGYGIKNKSMKYILAWTPPNYPFILLQSKQDVFIDNKCKHTNCFVTYDREYLQDIRDYDAVLFGGCSLRKMENKINLPQSRSNRQKYVFATIESSILYPITNPIYDDYFNWTWTTRLRSEISWNYLAIFDMNGTQVGPAIDMKWPKELKPINEAFKKKLRSKKKAVAWFVSHCNTHSGRENVVELLKEKLNKYDLTIDVYGSCANDICRPFWGNKMLKRDYYFYLSFENSLEEDYVTEKLLTPLINTAVPVVYGGANYSRFLPPGSYLNARELGYENLAKAMNDAIRNLTLYYDFFRWTNHFKYEKSYRTTDLCNICTALNNEKMVNRISTYKNFRLWWNGAAKQNLYEFMLKIFVMNKDLQKIAADYNFTRAGSLVLLKNIRNQTNDFLINMLNVKSNHF